VAERNRSFFTGSNPKGIDFTFTGSPIRLSCHRE
jgi:hypothetical protein